MALAVFLVLRLTLAEHPLAGVGGAFGLGAGLLALLAVWTLASSNWSDAPGRALVEYNRVLLYLLGLLAIGTAARSPGGLRWMARGIALGIFAVCLCGFVTRAAPDLWAVAGGVDDNRLSFPLTYFNALGLLAAIGVVICLALTSDRAEAPAGRVLAAAALPVLTAVLMLTYSRGAMAACLAGIVILIVIARPGAILSGLAVALPAAGVALKATYDAVLLATDRATSAAGIAQGHDLALQVAACAAGAAIVRAVLLGADERVAASRLAAAARRRGVMAAVAVGLLVGGTAMALVLGAPAALERQYDRFVAGDRVKAPGGLRARLTNPGNNGRLDQWEVALDAFAGSRLHGHGAGTYALLWERNRPVADQVEDGHSLYLELLGELGLVGLVLAIGAIGIVLGALAARTRGPERVAAGALLAAASVWALHAGIDWDWEMPAVTLWVFAAGGAALRQGAAPGPALGRTARVVAALGCLVLAIVPLRLFFSEAGLRDSRRAFAAGDCPRAIDRALDSTDWVAARAEPFVIVGYCDVRLGRPALAVRALRAAVARDPGNWEYRYALALVLGAAGRDPRDAARAALTRNPREELASKLVAAFDTDDAATWRKRALSARLPSE